MTHINIKKTFDTDETKNVDVCIIGTGAGGSVVGHHLSKSGYKVLMLEKGDYYSLDYIKNEKKEENLIKLWKNMGIQATRIPFLSIIQGECVGGSTVINYGICFRMPEYTFNSWKGNFNVKFSREELDKAYKEVEDQISVRQITKAGTSHEKLEKGCRILGFSGDWMNKNYIETEEGGVKQNVLISYLEKSPSDKLEIYANCKAEKILKNGNEVIGVRASHTNESGKPITINVKSKIVILSAGPIASSEILLKSKIANSSGHVGKHLSFHPASFVIAQFDEPIEGQNDIAMAFYCDKYSVLKENKPGFMIESIFISPAQFSAATPGIGDQNREYLENYNKSAMAGILIQDEPNGSVSLNWSKEAIIDYTLSESDGKKLVDGMIAAAKIYFAAGAVRVTSGHIKNKEILPSDDVEEIIETEKVGPESFRLASAHPQGGNRMGEDPKKSVVNSYCRCHDIKNLYICDASVFPTSLGVNPQLTVMAIATMAAKRIIDQGL